MKKQYRKKYYTKYKKKILEKSKQWIKAKLETDPEYARRVKRASKIRARQRNRNIIQNIKKQGECVHCKCKDWICLEFDHIDSNTKKYTISRMIFDAMSEKTLRKELDKCQLLCGNCHQKKHTFVTKFCCKKLTYVHEYKKNHPCIDCGEDDFRCLEFHHLESDKKEYTISFMYKHKIFTLDDVIEEIKKCVVLCRNCHYKRHRISDEITEVNQ